MHRIRWLVVALAGAPAFIGLTSGASAASDVKAVRGQGTPLLDAAQSGTSVGIVAKGTLYVFDAGAGASNGGSMSCANGMRSSAIRQIGLVFATHLHMTSST